MGINFESRMDPLKKALGDHVREQLNIRRVNSKIETLPVPVFTAHGAIGRRPLARVELC